MSINVIIIEKMLFNPLMPFFFSSSSMLSCKKTIYRGKLKSQNGTCTVIENLTRDSILRPCGPSHYSNESEKDSRLGDPIAGPGKKKEEKAQPNGDSNGNGMRTGK